MRGLKNILGMGLLFLSVSLLAFGEEEIDVNVTGHLRVAAGLSSGDFEELASHEHDPNQDFVLQGLELGLNLRAGKYLEGYANGILFQTPDDEFEGEWEEGFLKLKNLPGGLELRGGRYLNRIGLQNNQHLHSWDFVDANLSTGSFLGEEGLITEGGELTWFYEVGETLIGFSGSYGSAVVHEEEEEEVGGHGGEETLFSDEVYTLRLFATHRVNDFHSHRVGLNHAAGDNGYGRDTTLWSLDYTFTWRENGLEAGGRGLRVGVEAMYRDIEWIGEVSGALGDSSQRSFLVEAIYDFDADWQLATRYEWLEGVETLNGDFELEERQRFSLAVKRLMTFNDDLSGQVRLQYNHDELEEGGEDTIWLQFGFDFGAEEVR